MNQLPLGHNNNVATLSKLAIADAIASVKCNIKYGPSQGSNIGEVEWADLFNNARQSLHGVYAQRAINEILNSYLLSTEEKRMYGVILDDVYLTAWKSAALTACQLLKDLPCAAIQVYQVPNVRD